MSAIIKLGRKFERECALLGATCCSCLSFAFGNWPHRTRFPCAQHQDTTRKDTTCEILSLFEILAFGRGGAKIVDDSREYRPNALVTNDVTCCTKLRRSSNIDQAIRRFDRAFMKKNEHLAQARRARASLAVASSARQVKKPSNNSTEHSHQAKAIIQARGPKQISEHAKPTHYALAAQYFHAYIRVPK